MRLNIILPNIVIIIYIVSIITKKTLKQKHRKRITQQPATFVGHLAGLVQLVMMSRKVSLIGTFTGGVSWKNSNGDPEKNVTIWKERRRPEIGDVILYNHIYIYTYIIYNYIYIYMYTVIYMSSLYHIDIGMTICVLSILSSYWEIWSWDSRMTPKMVITERCSRCPRPIREKSFCENGAYPQL